MRGCWQTERMKLKESQTIEFKKSLAERREILETISAFANSKGGKIFVGVEENRDGSVKEIVGIRIRGREIENLGNEIKQNMDPVVFPSIEIEKIMDKDVIVIEIRENPIKPVFVKGEVYKRVGRTNQKLSTLEIRELTRESVDYNFTELVCEDAKLEDIAIEKIGKFAEKAKEERNYDIEYKSREDFLKKMHLLTDKGVTYAALLLFGREPQRFVLQSEIRCARFKGLDVLEFEDMEVIKGTAIEQVERSMGFVKRNLKVEVTFGDQIERMERWEYPLLAIKEAVTNAVCHRDYTLNSNVQVRIFDDRIEIWSPGGLPKGLSVEDLKRTHESIPRNKLIANAFFMVKYIEQWGTGTNRMIRWCLNEGLPEPEFEDMKRVFIVGIRKDIYTEEYLKDLKLNEREINAVLYVKEKGEITNREYQKINRISKRIATEEWRELVKKNILVMTGRGKRDLRYIPSIQKVSKKYPKKGLKNAKPDEPDIKDRQNTKLED